MELIIYVVFIVIMTVLDFVGIYFVFDKQHNYKKGLISGYQNGYEIGFKDGSLYKKKKRKAEEWEHLEKLFEENKTVYVYDADRFIHPLNTSIPLVEKLVEKKKSKIVSSEGKNDK